MPYRFVMGVGFTEEDEYSLRAAWANSSLRMPLRFVGDSAAALAQLQALEAMPADCFQMPALLLMDFDTSPLHALDLLRYARQRRTFRELVIVLCASDWSPEQGKQAYAWGTDCCADKDASFREVIRLLRRVEDYWFAPARQLAAA